jgi:hypothetical protein
MLTRQSRIGEMGLVLMMDWIHFLFDFSFVDFGLMGVV